MVVWGKSPQGETTPEGEVTPEGEETLEGGNNSGDLELPPKVQGEARWLEGETEGEVGRYSQWWWM